MGDPKGVCVRDPIPGVLSKFDNSFPTHKTPGKGRFHSYKMVGVHFESVVFRVR